MKAWLIDIRDALLLRSTAFARLQERPDAFFRGFIVIVVVALLVGLPAFVIDVVQGFGPAAVVEPTELQPGLHFGPIETSMARYVLFKTDFKCCKQRCSLFW